MRIFIVGVFALLLVADTPPVPATYKSAAEITAELDKAGQVSRVGASVTVINASRYHAVVRRRSASGTPQNAIVHPKSSEVYQVMEGSGTLVGVLDPPPGTETVQNSNNITSTGIRGGLSRALSKGDVAVIPAGTPHWFSKIDGSITYLEVQFETE